MKSGHGSLKWKRTRPGSTIWTSRTRSLRSLAAAPRYRSKENLTSSAVTGPPLWNFTPLRRTNSYVRPSFDTVHDSARLRESSPAGSGAGAVRPADRHHHGGDGAGLGVRDAHDQPALEQVLALAHLGHGLDAAGRHAGLVEPLEPVGGGAAAELRVELRDQRLAVRH